MVQGVWIATDSELWLKLWPNCGQNRDQIRGGLVRQAGAYLGTPTSRGERLPNQNPNSTSHIHPCSATPEWLAWGAP